MKNLALHGVSLGLFLVGLGMVAGPAAGAQQPRGGGGTPIAGLTLGGSHDDVPRKLDQRVLQGRVEDANGKGVKNAMVFLKDAKTNAVKSTVVDEQGGYRFVQLNQNTDYELWAKVAEKKSPSKGISSFDTKKEITMNLKIE